MSAPNQALGVMKLLIYFVVGFLAPLVWAPLAGWSAAFVIQYVGPAIVAFEVALGIVAGIVFVAPLVLLVRPTPAFGGFAFSVGFLIFLAYGVYASGGKAGHLSLLLSSFDLWALLAAAILLVLLSSRVQGERHAIQPRAPAERP
ncbi:MAG: hypothetical protein NVS9B10_30640 [Nevskia sp.]